jgi:hypothetical protein
MSLYFFDVTVRVVHDGRPTDVVLRKAARAASEHQARRAVLDRYLDAGFQVAKLRRAPAPTA